jgi:hypothetical protein
MDRVGDGKKGGLMRTPVATLLCILAAGIAAVMDERV